jgi:hypothetical protein
MTGMTLFDLLVPWALIVAALYILRRLERWLAQHIFKVGWLVTHNLHMTTLVYYIFYLPGVILHTLSTYLAASLLNVRAERAFALPPEQEIAELKLNFIRLPRQVSPMRRRIIALAPFVAGVFVLSLLGYSVFRVETALVFITVGGLGGLPDMLAFLGTTPDLWLWAYVAFTIGNTMMPHWEELRPSRRVLFILGGVLLVLTFAGVGASLLSSGIARPLVGLAYVLDTALILLIAIDLIMVGVLGTAEAVIERVTQRSATFQRGKLIRLTREEALALKEQQRAKEAKKAEGAKKAAEPRETVTPSVYRLPLPFPTVPKDGIDRFIGPSA